MTTKATKKPQTKRATRQPEPVYDGRPWRRLANELHACTREYPDRTPYFYRKQAIAWRRHLNYFEWFKNQHSTAMYFAKMYLGRYREMLGQWADIAAGKCRSNGLGGVVELRKGVAA